MIKLRELSITDLTKLNSWRNDNDIISCLVAPFRYINRETDEKWFANYMTNRSHNVRCVLFDEEDANEIFGYVGLTDIDYIARKSGFYIFIDKNYQGKQYGYRASKLILEHAFLNLNLNRVELTVLEKNQRAISLYNKVGFQKEGIQRQAVYKNGHFENLIFMAILKEDFC